MSVIPTELGTKKISSLLLGYAVPGIIAMTASSLYNMVDSIYIGHIKDVGTLAISGLAVTFPLMNLSAALGTLVGVGAATMLSVLLGQKNYETANKVLSNAITMNVIFATLFTVLTIGFLEPILYFFGASDNIMPYARDYTFIILLGNVFTHMYFGLNACIRASGNPKMAMGLTIFTVAFNSILDPIFIFWLDMGVKGAAIATVIAQFAALVITFQYFMNQEKTVHFVKGIFAFDMHIAKKALSIGMGPFLMNSAACIVTLFINQQLRKYGGDLAIGAYGIVGRISFMFIMIVMGICQGMQPIAGYNYGSRQYSRVKEVYKLTVLWSSLVTIIGFLISEFLAEYAVRIFTPDPVMKERAAEGLRYMNLIFPIIGFQMVSTFLFQCLGMVKKSVTLSLTRQLIFLVPLVYFLPLFFEIKGVWMSFPIADFLSSALTLIFILNLFSKFNKLKDGDEPTILGSNI